MMPDENAATTARRPTLRIVIAMSSSIRPKPLSRRSARTISLSAPRCYRSSAPMPLPIRNLGASDGPLLRLTHGGIRIQRDQRAGPRAARRDSRAGLGRGARAAAHARPARAVSRRASRRRGGGRSHCLQEDQAEVAPDLLSPVCDDDRRRALSRGRPRHPRGADRRQVPRNNRRGTPSRRRGWPSALAGEAAGILDQVLDRVAFQIEKETQIKRRVKGAMIYPTMVLIFATLVLIGMLLFLVPIFVKIFEDLGGDLPTLTQKVVNTSNFLRADW